MMKKILTKSERAALRRMKKKEMMGKPFCHICGRELTDPESIKRGFGPECAKVAKMTCETMTESMISVELIASALQFAVSTTTSKLEKTKELDCVDDMFI